MRAKHVFVILLLASLGLVVVLFIHARQSETVVTAAPAATPGPVHEILVASRPLPAGLLLRAQDVTWRKQNGDPQSGQVERPSAETRATTPEIDDEVRSGVYGAALRTNLGEREPIRRSDIVKPGDRDFLGTVLTQGERALTVPVSVVGGGTGLMFPGDHVDVMLTQTFKNEEAPLTRRSVSETVVGDLRILAIDRSAKGSSGGAMSVTLEVKPEQAEKINVAVELGKLSLTLRSLDERVSDQPLVGATSPSTPTPAATWAGDVSPALKSAMPPAKVIQAEKPAIKVMHGGNSVDTRTQ
jgi:pilus assembly protein CpaB